jgi:hypothetical protein
MRAGRCYKPPRRRLYQADGCPYTATVDGLVPQPSTDCQVSSQRPKWRNWQTRRIQNPVGFTARVGSIPTFGIQESAEFMPLRQAQLRRMKCRYHQMDDPDQVLRQIKIQVDQLHQVRALFPHMSKDLIGHQQCRTAPLYRGFGYDITFSFAQPLTEEDIDRCHAIGDWINQSFVIRLWALLESHGVLGNEGSGKKIDDSLAGHDEVDILRRLRHEFAHSGGHYDPNDTDERRLFERIVKHFGVTLEDHPPDHPGFPIPIDRVLMPLAEGCKRYVEALAWKGQ